MVHLILVRHAEAVAASSAVADDKRPLTKAGVEDAAATGLLLKGLGLPQPTILCSPRQRALETARIIAARMEAREPYPMDSLLGGYEPDAVLSTLDGQSEPCFILVGHEPDMGRLLGRLLNPASQAAIPFTAAGFAWVELQGVPMKEPGRLRLFGDPRRLGATKPQGSS